MLFDLVVPQLLVFKVQALCCRLGLCVIDRLGTAAEGREAIIFSYLEIDFFYMLEGKVHIGNGRDIVTTLSLFVIPHCLKHVVYHYGPLRLLSLMLLCLELPYHGRGFFEYLSAKGVVSFHEVLELFLV